MGQIPSYEVKLSTDSEKDLREEKYAGIVSNQITQPSRNLRYETLEDGFKANGFEDMEFKEVIGEGAFGTIYKYIGNKDGKYIIVAVKKSEFLIRKDDFYILDLLELSNEVEFSLYMSENNLSPKIYSVFFIESTFFDPTFQPKGNEKKEIVGDQYFIMEKMDMDGHKFLSSEDYSIEEKEKVVQEMVNLLTKVIFKFGILYADTKPANFLINVEKENTFSFPWRTPKNTFKVRITDFSGSFCYKDEDEIVMNYISNRMDKKLVFYLIQLIQLKMVIHLSIGIDYDSPIYDPINLNPKFLNLCKIIEKNEKLIEYIYKDVDLPIKHYSRNKENIPQLFEIYKAAGCSGLYYKSNKLETLFKKSVIQRRNEKIKQYPELTFAFSKKRSKSKRRRSKSKRRRSKSKRRRSKRIT